MSLYKSPNVFYIGDPVLTPCGHGVIKKFDGATVWIRLDLDPHTNHLHPMEYKNLKRIDG